MERVRSFLDGPWEKSYDPMVLLRMRVDTVNNTVGDLKGYDCKKCRNRGYTAFITEDNTMSSRDCGCKAVRRALSESERSGLNRVLQSKDFDGFRPEQPWQRRMLEKCREYAASPKGWLLLSGQSGSGKTHLCAAVCNRLLADGHSVRYLSWRETVVQLKGLAMDYDRQQALLEVYKTAQVLYIDDLYKCGGTPTAADISLAFELLNYRYNNGLTTILSTEQTPQQLTALDEATGSRIIEMAGSNLLVIPRDLSRNYRLRGAKPSN